MRTLTAIKKIIPFAFWLILAFGFDKPYVVVLTLLCALLHEIGHIFIIHLIFGSIFPLPHATVSGFRLPVSKLLSYREELLIALGGPLINIVTAIAFLPLTKNNDYVLSFVLINLLTAFSNLLPLPEYDGFRILRSILYMLVSPQKAEFTLMVFSFATAALLVFLSLFFILNIGEGYWIFAIFFASLIGILSNFYKPKKCEK